MSRVSVDQERASRAFAAVPDCDLDLAKKLPTMLQTNGLLASFAFLLKKDEADAIRRSLLGHLRARMGEALVPQAKGRAAEIGLLERWCDAQRGLSANDLRRLTGESLAFSVWLKRAAEAHTPR